MGTDRATPLACEGWNDQDYDGIVQAIKEEQHFLVTTHISPDGDAVGSARAMRNVLQALGKDVWLYHAEGAPSPSLCPFLGVDGWRDDLPDDIGSRVAFILDCGSLDRVGDDRIVDAKLTINIDHHPTNTAFADLNAVHPDRAATCEMLVDLCDKLDMPLNVEIAESLYTGIFTDTGWLRYANTTEHTLAVIDRLAERLGGRDEIEARIKAVPAAWEEYAAAVLGRCRPLDGSGIVFSEATLADLDYAGVDHASVKEAATISTDTVFWAFQGQAELLLLAYEHPGGKRSFSLRAYDPERIHCGEIAEALGGGGHRAAAGFSTGTEISAVTVAAQVVALYREQH